MVWLGEPAAMENVVALRVNFVSSAVGRVTVRSSSQAPLRVAVMMDSLTRAGVRVDATRSQMVVGLGVMVSVARCLDVTWLPYLRTGYWDVVPKFQGSSVPVTPSMSLFQAHSANMSAVPSP